MSYLYGVIIRSKRQMISSAQWWVFASHVHFQMLEKIVVFARRERYQNSDRSGE